MIPSTVSAESAGGRSFRGPDRRRHRVYITHHSEYHCREGVCVAVRDRKTGEFVRDHGAIGRHISGSIRFNDYGSIADVHDPKNPAIGEQLCFCSGDVDDPHDILTSPLTEIARPPKEIAECYPALVAIPMRTSEALA